MKYLPNLTRLSITGNMIGNEGAMVIVEALECAPSLRKFEICGNRFDDVIVREKIKDKIK